MRIIISKGVFFMNDKRKKFDPIKREPEDNVGTVYCGEDTEEYNNILSEDIFPYSQPLPRYRNRPEPPII